MSPLLRRALYSIAAAQFFCLSGWSTEPIRALDLPASATIKNGLFEVTAPKNWSYRVDETAEPRDDLKVKGMSAKTTEHVSLTPTSPPESSFNWISISDRIPHALFDAEATAKLREPPLKVQAVNWNGQQWNLVEEVITVNSIKMVSTRATTKLHDRDLELSAQFPVSEDSADRPIFKKVFETIRVLQH